MKSRMLTMKEITELSKELTQRVKTCQPEYVISIERGGCFIGEVIAQELNLPHHSIRIKRWYEKMPPFCYSFVRFLRNDLPSPFNKICGYLVNQLICFISSVAKPKLIGEFNSTIDLDARILLVDDDIGTTGITMTSSLNYLQQKGFKNISTAIIIQYGKKIIADYSVINNSSSRIIFPWPWRETRRNQQTAPL